MESLELTIVNKSAKTLGDAFGMAHGRAEFLAKKMDEFHNEKNSTAEMLRLISIECVSPNELACMAFMLGKEDMKTILMGIMREF
ncbi:hypothetical protein [Flavobacterium sp.]|uniref:hypothetical protein n=1 Tax=Flavobacterium sp. TaxID=239 RepID=UPI002B4B6A54|nr:hypothetical protein [Flavobacterium sp.]HLF52782.1 hypothetical protein [Flavobacterium sp.]